MTIKNKEQYANGDPRQRLRRKADHEWDMAGMARKDEDFAAAEKHTEQAREYERQIREYSS